MATVEHCLYCFEALTADLASRTPMTLHQVETAWAEYPNEESPEHSLDQELDADDEPAASDSSNSAPPKANKKKPSHKSLSRLAGSSRSSGSNSSTAGSSSSSLSPSTTETTPSSSNTFMPIGISPDRSSQRKPGITESPLFVTWNTISPRNGSRSLRGCIGTFEAQPLADGLKSYALISALHDSRFSPVAAPELPTLEASVTLLTDFENADSALDWELGVHGLRISFTVKGRRYGACYLPDVPVEQDWTKEETVVSLMRKAGWGGRREKWEEVDLKVVRFQGVVESVSYADYKHWRDWVEQRDDKS